MEKEKLFNVKLNLSFIGNDKQKEIELLESLWEDVKKNPKFLIPINYKESDIKKNTGKKNNACKKCRFNCHLNCNCFKKSFCKCMNFKFKCKVCPNKCSNDSHYVCDITYPQYEYKTIDQYLLKDKDFDKIDSVDSKFAYIIKILREELEEIKIKINDIEDNFRKMSIEKKNSNVDLISLNKSLNYSIFNFNRCLEITQYTKKYTVWQEEILLYVVKPFFFKKKIYEYIKEKDDEEPKENCNII